MNDIAIEATTQPSESDVRVIDEGLSRHNEMMIGPRKCLPVGCFARKGDQVVGGITGELFWDYLYIDMMWIEEAHRGSGIGRELIRAVEELSMKHGVYRSHLCTASFQSLGFYEKCGYTVFGRLEEMPKGETEYYLHKRLER